MTLDEFLQHWSITENPFRAEEARSDTVFMRMSVDGSASSAVARGPMHSDFEKILGDLSRPASAVVFGEKGSGKTAMRLQIAARVRAHNLANPTARVLLIPYDDLNAVLDRFHQRSGAKTPAESLAKLRLVDHIDGILHQVVPKLTDAALGSPADDAPDMGQNTKRTLRKMDRQAKLDFLLLQALYDRPDQTPLRTEALRKRLGVRRGLPYILGLTVAWAAPLVLAGLAVWARYFGPPEIRSAEWLNYVILGLVGIYVMFLLKFLLVDGVYFFNLGRRLRQQVRVSPRSERSYAHSLRPLPATSRGRSRLPLSDSDEPRYLALQMLRRVMAVFGYAGIIVIVDRLDEPTLVSGDAERMRAVAWPMLSNKFLQQEGIGVKLLLPMDLRHAVLKESNAFFQGARLDKQCFIERLAWSGPMLYDLCSSRLAACRAPTAAPMTLMDLFDPEVASKEMIDTLEQLHQPRDAFKFLYRCLAEHCASITRDHAVFRVPRAVFESVKKQEIERIAQVYRGIRPA